VTCLLSSLVSSFFVEHQGTIVSRQTFINSLCKWKRVTESEGKRMLLNYPLSFHLSSLLLQSVCGEWKG
jgi:DNA-binding winged helix-turn-helix (wHTH) protein